MGLVWHRHILGTERMESWRMSVERTWVDAKGCDTNKYEMRTGGGDRRERKNSCAIGRIEMRTVLIALHTMPGV